MTLILSRARTVADRLGGRPGLGAILVPILLAVSGCGFDPDDAVVVDGSSTVYRISKAAQESYYKVRPDVAVVVDNHGTGGGFGRYLQGEVNIIAASRPAKPEEERKAKQLGLDWTRFLIAYDGITVVVNPANDFVDSLTVAQLQRLWEPASQVATWKDLDPSWPDRRIILYSPDTDSGTYEFFVDAILGPLGHHHHRRDVQASSDDNTLITGVAGDLDGIGYFGFAYYTANADRLKAVAIQDGPDAEPVLPDRNSIFRGRYTPLSRPLFLYAKNAALRRADVQGFLEFYLEHVATFAETAGYVAPTPEDQAENLRALIAATRTLAARGPEPGDPAL